eukprot:GILJ01006078.1.p1 GENE.GILJ01006078.1~~GILJ01006078.1.p1  ORF type:complete len:660 (-),score=88.18 GILJ01006078.1:89-2068(-)
MSADVSVDTPLPPFQKTAMVDEKLLVYFRLHHCNKRKAQETGDGMIEVCKPKAVRVKAPGNYVGTPSAAVSNWKDNSSQDTNPKHPFLYGDLTTVASAAIYHPFVSMPTTHTARSQGHLVNYAQAANPLTSRVELVAPPVYLSYMAASSSTSPGLTVNQLPGSSPPHVPPPLFTSSSSSSSAVVAMLPGVQLLHSFLQELDLLKYIDHFHKEAVDYYALILLTEDDLKEVGIPMGPRKKMMDALKRKNPQIKQNKRLHDNNDGGEEEEEDIMIQEKEHKRKRAEIEPTTGGLNELDDEESREVGDHTIKNVGGVYSCTCPAWKFQSRPIDKRTCRHLREFRGDEAETERIGKSFPVARKKRKTTKSKNGDDDEEDEEDGEDEDGSVAGTPKIKSFSGVLLAHKYEDKIDPTGWWMSEKLDGARAYWNGEMLLSRNGKQFFAPDFYVAKFPKDCHLDGELWLGRGEFQRCMSIVRRHGGNKLWEDITYVVFDAPNIDKPFEERYEHFCKLIGDSGSEYMRAHKHIKCKDRDALQKELERVQAKSGEGLMLRKPGSRYERTRSRTLLKVKTFSDAEAIVTSIERGSGRHSARMGALHVRTKTGITFKVGTGFSDKEREKPPKVGTIITYRYQELTKSGRPRFPAFLRVRTDMTREEFEKAD